MLAVLQESLPRLLCIVLLKRVQAGLFVLERAPCRFPPHIWLLALHVLL